MGSQTPTNPIHLAILEADTPLPQTRAKYGSCGGVFESLLTRAAAPAPLSSVATLTYHHIVGPSAAAAYPSLDDVDAVLITGSKHNAFEDGEGNWIADLAEFVRRALESERGIRVVGVCFGHQIVARALGVPVGRSARGWEVSVTEVKLTEKGREVFGRDTLVSALSSFFSSPSLSPLSPISTRHLVGNRELTRTCRKSTRCTGTPYPRFRPARSRWPRTTSVPSRGSSYRAK